MARKKAQVVPPGTSDEDNVSLRDALMAQGTLRMVQKQADRIHKLFQLPVGYPDRGSAVIDYQDALRRNGVEFPPETIHEAIELINQVGEFHG